MSARREAARWGWMAVRTARRLVIAVVGGTLLLVGVAMMVLPGPAVVVIPLGLAVLAVEFTWARRFLERVRKEWDTRTGGGARRPEVAGARGGEGEAGGDDGAGAKGSDAGERAMRGEGAEGSGGGSTPNGDEAERREEPERRPS